MLAGPRPEWLTFDCYGTLIQWDEGLAAAVRSILSRSGGSVDPNVLLAIYDRHEHRLEQQRPHMSFRDVSAEALRLTMAELALPFAAPAQAEPKKGEGPKRERREHGRPERHTKGEEKA